jgi:hypothetical protein
MGGFVLNGMGAGLNIADMESGPQMIGESPVPAPAADDPSEPRTAATPPPVEIGGRDGPEPTRFGDWEKNGRCIDF